MSEPCVERVCVWPQSRAANGCDCELDVTRAIGKVITIPAAIFPFAGGKAAPIIGGVIWLAILAWLFGGKR